MFALFRLLGLVTLWEFWKSRQSAKAFANLLPGVAMAVAAFFLLIAASRIALTIDAIQSPTMRAVYAGFVAVILAALISFLYLYYWRRPSRLAAREPPSRQRLDELYGKHGVAPRTYGESRKRRLIGLKRQKSLSFAICGLSGSGTQDFTVALDALLAKAAWETSATLIELPALSSSAAENQDTLEMALSADLVLFVADQDLRSYETAFIRSILEAGRPVIIAVDKSDRMTEEDRAETQTSIAGKFMGARNKPDIVFVNSAPLPVRAVVVSVDGSEREEWRMPAPDLSALIARLPHGLAQIKKAANL